MNSSLPTLDKYKEYIDEVTKEYGQLFLTEKSKRKINLIADNFLQVQRDPGLFSPNMMANYIEIDESEIDVVSLQLGTCFDIVRNAM